VLDNQLIKIGTSPKTVYKLKQKFKTSKENIPEDFAGVINANFLAVTPTGERLDGSKAFAYWCTERKLPVAKTALEYVKTLEKYKQYKKENNLINGLLKLENTKGIGTINLDNLYYADFYGTKQSANKRSCRFNQTKFVKAY